MSDWRRFDLHPWDVIGRRKYGYVTLYGDGWIVVEPNTCRGNGNGTIHAIWHMLTGNPICWRVAGGSSYGEVMRLADEWIAEREAALVLVREIPC